MLNRVTVEPQPSPESEKHLLRGGPLDDESHSDQEIEQRRVAAQANWAEYLRRVEAHELEPGQVELGYIASLNERGIPITRGDCMVHGPQAIVLSEEDFSKLAYIDILWRGTEEDMRISWRAVSWMGTDDRFVIFPDDLAE